MASICGSPPREPVLHGPLDSPPVALPPFSKYSATFGFCSSSSCLLGLQRNRGRACATDRNALDSETQRAGTDRDLRNLQSVSASSHREQSPRPAPGYEDCLLRENPPPARRAAVHVVVIPVGACHQDISLVRIDGWSAFMSEVRFRFPSLSARRQGTCPISSIPLESRIDQAGVTWRPFA